MLEKFNNPNINHDYVAWLETQVENLRSGNYEQLDIHNLITELTTLIYQETGEVRNYVYNVLVCFLLINYGQQDVSQMEFLLAEINVHRLQLNSKMANSFRFYLEDNIEEIYNKAKQTASLKIGVSRDKFPLFCPFKLDEIIGEQYFNQLTATEETLAILSGVDTTTWAESDFRT